MAVFMDIFFNAESKRIAVRYPTVKVGYRIQIFGYGYTNFLNMIKETLNVLQFLPNYKENLYFPFTVHIYTFPLIILSRRMLL